MYSFGTILRKNVNLRNHSLFTSSYCLRFCLILNVLSVVLSFYANAFYLDDSMSTLVQCADTKCKGVISYAETQGSYPSRDSRILGFKSGQKVIIYAKPTYNTLKYVFGEINNRKGYIPLNLIRETKVVTRNLVPVLLPKGISNIVEDVSDDNSDKSTAGTSPNPETLGSTVNDDAGTSTISPDHEAHSVTSETQNLSNEKEQLPASDSSLNSDNSSNVANEESNSNHSKTVTSNNVTNPDIKKSENKSDTVGNESEVPPKSESTENSGTNELTKSGENKSSAVESDSGVMKDENKAEAKEENMDQINPSVKNHEINVTNDKANESVTEANTSRELNEEGDELSEPNESAGFSSNSSEPEVIANKEPKKADDSINDSGSENNQAMTSHIEKNANELPEKSLPDTPSENIAEMNVNNSARVKTEEIPKAEDKKSIAASEEPPRSVEEDATEIPQSRGDVDGSEGNSLESETTAIHTDEKTKEDESMTKTSHTNATNAIPSYGSSKEAETKEAAAENESETKAPSTNVNDSISSRDNSKGAETKEVADEDESATKAPNMNTFDERAPYESSKENSKSDITSTQSPINIVNTNDENTTPSVSNLVEKSANLTSEGIIQESDQKSNETLAKNSSVTQLSNETDESVKTENKTFSTPKEDIANDAKEGVALNSNVIGSINLNVDNEKKENVIRNDEAHDTDTEAPLGSDNRENSFSKYKVNLTAVNSDSVSSSKMVVTEEEETLRPEAVLEKSQMHSHYEDSSTSASILFTIIPKEYIDILRIYITIFSDMLPDNLRFILASLRISSHVVVLTFLCGALWLTMYFIGALFSLFNKDSSLRAELCDFQVKFFKMKNERDSLRSLLQTEQEKCFEFDEKISEKEQKISFLEKEYERVKKERVELQEKVIALEADVTHATDAGLEMNAVLSDFLTSQKENVSLNSKVESLQNQITKQEEFISNLRKSYRSTKEENAELKHMQEKASAELERLTRLLDDTDTNLKKFQSNNEALKSSNNEMLQQLKELEESKTNLIYELRKLEEEKEEREALTQKLEEEISSLNSISEEKSSEIKSLQEVIRSLKEDTEDNVDDLFDVAKVKTALDVVQKEKSEIASKYEHVVNEREKLTQTLKSLEESNAKCKESEEKALKAKVDAQNNLEILKNYFAAKETELQQKVGELQVLKQQREESSNSLLDRLKYLEEENAAYKSQVETMKKELIDSDKNWKAQLAKMEKTAHENWVASRNAHREMEALKSDSAALRQHLSMKAKSTVDGNSSLDDDEPMSLPSFMPPPPPFGPFPSFDDKADTRRWEGAPPPPPPMPPFGAEFDNMPPMPLSFNSLASHHQSLPHPMGSFPMQWDSPSSRDAFSPISQQSHERRSSRGNSPMHSTISGSSSMRGTMPHPPVSNYAPYTPHQMYGNSAQFSNPASHWTRPNGNVTNSAVSKQNHDKKKSRSDSRSSMSNASLHASNV